MADIKHSQDPTTAPTLTDLILALNGTPSNVNFTAASLKALFQQIVQLDTAVSTPPWTAGQIWWADANKCAVSDTGIPGVRNCIGQENYIPVYNDTGVTIENGTPVMTTGVYVNDVPSVIPADADSPLSALGFLGVVTADILDGEQGLSTILGAVNDVDTSALQIAPAFLGSGGGIVNTPPIHPAQRLLIGGVTKLGLTDGIIGVGPTRFPRQNLSRSYGFTSQGIGAGSYWKAGFYDWSSTDVSLTNVSPTVSYGTAGRTYAAHASIVASGPGSVTGTGQVGLRVTGTLDSETGPQVGSQTDIITEDITTLSADTYYETPAKFSGDITFELYVVSGTPTAFDLTFNYGYSKYDDFKNKDFTIAAFECVWQGNANDSAFDVTLYKHSSTGWTYAATGFEPGNGILANRLTDQALESSVINDQTGAWKRVDLNEFVNGSGDEGFLIQVVTGQNNTIQTMDMHIEVFSEELTE